MKASRLRVEVDGLGHPAGDVDDVAGVGDLLLGLLQGAGQGRGGESLAAEKLLGACGEVDVAATCRKQSGRTLECARAGYSILSRCCSARDAPMAVSTCLTSSGGGSTAGRPSALIHSSRHQPVVW